jgi:short-subunit dehydrogenase
MESTKLFAGPLVMSAQEVAQIGWDAMKRGKHLVVAGRMNATLAFVTRFAPRQMAASIARFFTGKKVSIVEVKTLFAAFS